MAFYRRGHKVPAMATKQRDVVGLLTIVFVFALVAATAWRPLWFALPSLVIVAGLVVFDHAVVDLRGASASSPDTSGADTGARTTAISIVGASDVIAVPAPDAATASARTRAYAAGPNVAASWRAGRARPGSRRASWLDDPAGDSADRLDVPTTGVDMRAFLD